MTSVTEEPLRVQRRIHAPCGHVFEAWTQPGHLTKWWGPKGVECLAATVDLRVGGSYRIVNRFDDGRILWISGQFERIEPPHELVYTWQVEAHARPSERVSVRFEPFGDATEVIVTHERIPDPKIRHDHEAGWNGCLDKLQRYLAIACPI